MLVRPPIVQYKGGAPLEHHGDRTAALDGNHSDTADLNKGFDTIKSPQVLVS